MKVAAIGVIRRVFSNGAAAAAPQAMSIDWRATRTWLENVQRTKMYDLGVALPFIAWILFRVFERRFGILRGMQLLISGNINLRQSLQLISLLCSATFSVLLVYLLLMRKIPERKAKGILPRVVAIGGTFSTVSFLLLNPVRLSLPMQFLSLLPILPGMLGSLIAAARLGRSFSLLPEARQLVTSGPYAVIRHPLYVAEMITIVGLAIQFQQPWGLMIATVAFGFQSLAYRF